MIITAMSSRAGYSRSIIIAMKAFSIDSTSLAARLLTCRSIGFLSQSLSTDDIIELNSYVEIIEASVDSALI